MTADTKNQPTQPEAVTLRFARDKETTGTIRYAEVVPDDDVARVKNVYLQKFFAKELGLPDAITVTITAGSLAAGKEKRGPGAAGAWPALLPLLVSTAGRPGACAGSRLRIAGAGRRRRGHRLRAGARGGGQFEERGELPRPGRCGGRRDDDEVAAPGDRVRRLAHTVSPPSPTGALACQASHASCRER